ncbi:hypothetical protein [Pseudoalteromonas phenolica]|uniref:Uncharacterized protein n=2 Tax=Pseudoalteromonas phenolica TaxID=161398 RepID=A0A0S2K8P6_9GAMM|nr:hypothetical protein [Pseudoalteromonas phenolica]ALO44403.1 hypothetical protein PP2015_3935 [Pseudoalteromonas phenolica]RXF01526.1 hypothetical protein D9981_08830 [Pseudoalteromonas phenolica O-BC30]
MSDFCTALFTNHRTRDLNVDQIHHLKPPQSDRFTVFSVMTCTNSREANAMLYYLITSQNYKTFRNIEDKVKGIAYVEDITHLCTHEPHPWHSWLTNKVAYLIKAELLFALWVVVSVFIAASVTELSTGLFVIGGVVVVLFSIWVCGLIGIEQVSHYISCQDMLKDIEDSLAMYIEAQEENKERIEYILNSETELNMYKVKV